MVTKILKTIGKSSYFARDAKNTKKKKKKYKNKKNAL
jgi:hypothetical protein